MQHKAIVLINFKTQTQERFNFLVIDYGVRSHLIQKIEDRMKEITEQSTDTLITNVQIIE